MNLLALLFGHPQRQRTSAIQLAQSSIPRPERRPIDTQKLEVLRLKAERKGNR